MFRVLVTDPVGEEGLAVLRTAAEVDVRIGLKPAELLEIIDGYDALVVRSETKVTPAVLEAGKALQVIGRAGTGVDNIDVEAATRLGVVVVNAPEANTIAAAEHTVALMLSLARHVPLANASLRGGAWQRSKFVGVELRNKTLGIIGLGRIGSEVARRARGLEMRVIAVDPFVTPERGQSLGVSLVSREELLAESDFITLHVLFTPGSRPVLGAEDFAVVKPGVRVINVARGGLIDETALLAAIESGQVAGAALDVFEKEPPTDSPLLQNDKVIVTPHLGASTAEAQGRVAADVAQQILDVFAGRAAIYAVNAPFVVGEAFKAIAPYIEAASQAASLATQLSDGQFESIEIDYLGDLANEDTTPLKAAVVRGLLAPVSVEKVTLVNANLVAEQRGLRITERKGPYEGVYASLIRVQLKTSAGSTSVSCTLAHDGIHIVEINDFWVDVLPGEGFLFLAENLDQPGMIGQIGTFLGKHDINISSMRVGREKVRGRALMVLGLDDELQPALLEEIRRIPNIFSARQAKI